MGVMTVRRTAGASGVTTNVSSTAHHEKVRSVDRREQSATHLIDNERLRRLQSKPSQFASSGANLSSSKAQKRRSQIFMPAPPPASMPPPPPPDDGPPLPTRPLGWKPADGGN